MQFVMFVLDDPDQLDAVLDAWEAVGVTGVTIVESTGFNRRRMARMVGKAFMAGFNRLVATGARGNLTLMTVVADSAMVQQCLVAAEGVVGDLNDPNTGVLMSWPVTFAKGIGELHDTQEAT